MRNAEIPCPEAVLLKKHILVMSFIGKDHVPAPKLKDVVLSSEDMKNAFYQVLHVRAFAGVLQTETTESRLSRRVSCCSLCLKT